MNRILSSASAIAQAGSGQTSVKGLANTLVNHESRRFGRRIRKWHHWPSDFLPFEWSRPVQVPPYMRTGDAVKDIGKWDPNELIPGAEHSEELKNAPEIVRRLFSLGLAERKAVVEKQSQKIVKEVQRHPFDETSPEVKIAQYTVKIRNNLHHFDKIDKYDVPRKIRQELMKNKRAVLMKELYYQDRERYDYMSKKLGINHQVAPLGEMYQKPTRKGELRRLTREYCDNLKQQRLDEYHAELKANQEGLEREIAEVEKLIKAEEKFMGTINNESKPQN